MNMHNLFLPATRLLTWMVVVLALGGCEFGPDEELTLKKPYADLIGTTYSVVTDNLYAYGVYESPNTKVITYVDLVPLRIGGREIAFEREVPKGQIIRILSAWRESVLLGSRLYYLVAIENLNLPPGVPVKLQLSRGNEGAGADLNPAIYKRLQKGN
jgi:hypothetical protein